MKSRAIQMLEKSVDAMLAAIEIYNKPDFSYREESFSILAINAWELLLKARLVQLGENKINAIIEYGRRNLKNGSPSKKLYRKLNRAGNYATVGMFRALDRLISEYGDKIHQSVRDNIEGMEAR